MDNQPTKTQEERSDDHQFNYNSLLANMADEFRQVLYELMTDRNIMRKNENDYNEARRGDIALEKCFYWAYSLAYALSDHSPLSTYNKNQICRYMDCLLEEFSTQEKPVTEFIYHTQYPVLKDVAKAFLRGKYSDTFGLS